MPVRIITGLLSRLATTAVMFASLVFLTWVGDHAGAPDPDAPPGSGIIVHTEIRAIWLPQLLLDQARDQGGLPVVRSPAAMRTSLEGSGWTAPWYALTCRSYQVNGQCSEFTQIRWLMQAADHLDELQAVMATAAGKPPRFEGSGFSHATAEVIPEALRTVEPRAAITRLIAESSVREEMPGTVHRGSSAL